MILTDTIGRWSDGLLEIEYTYIIEEAAKIPENSKRGKNNSSENFLKVIANLSRNIKKTSSLRIKMRRSKVLNGMK